MREARNSPKRPETTRKNRNRFGSAEHVRGSEADALARSWFGYASRFQPALTTWIVREVVVSGSQRLLDAKKDLQYHALALAEEGCARALRGGSGDS